MPKNKKSTPLPTQKIPDELYEEYEEPVPEITKPKKQKKPKKPVSLLDQDFEF